MATTFDYDCKTFTMPTDEQVKRRQEQLKRQGGSLVKMDDVRKMCRRILDVKNKTDIGFSFIQRVMDFGVFNKEEMNEQMKMWRDLAKNGKLQTYPENNMEYDIDGKKVYTLVITPHYDANFCPMSLAWGTMVSGYTYAFTKKENRDAVYGYVKKFCVVQHEWKEDIAPLPVPPRIPRK
jgi:hypothetical protein